MPRVIHFEIHAENPERAIAYYTTLFGWKFDKWPGPMDYYVIRTGEPGTPGIDGGMILRRGEGPNPGQPVNAFVCTIDVANLDETLDLAGKSGGTISVPRMPIPGVGWLAYLTDTEGNIVGVMQADAGAR